MSIPKKLVVLGSAMVAVCLTVLGAATVRFFEAASDQASSAAVVERLAQLHHQQSLELSALARRVEGSILTLASKPAVQEAARSFQQAFEQYAVPEGEDFSASLRSFYGSEFVLRYEERTSIQLSEAQVTPTDPRAVSLQAQYIALNPNPHDQREELLAASDGSDYSKVHEQLHPLLHREVDGIHGINDIYLVDLSGNVIYSTKKDINFARSLVNPFSASGPLSRAFEAAAELQLGGLCAVDFSSSPHTGGGYAAFVATPIFDGDSRSGTLVARVPAKLFQPTLSFYRQWSHVGLGKTGESVLLSQQGPSILSELRPWLERSQDTRLGLTRAGYTQADVEQVLRHRSTLGLSYAHADKIAKLEFRQPRAVLRSRDTLLAVSQLRLLGLEVVLSTQIEASEAFAREANPSKGAVGYALFIGVALTVLAAWLMWILGQNISRPLRELSSQLSGRLEDLQVPEAHRNPNGTIECRALVQAARSLGQQANAAFRELRALSLLESRLATAESRLGQARELVSNTDDVVREAEREAKLQVEDSSESLEVLDQALTVGAMLEERARSARALCRSVLEASDIIEEQATEASRSVDQLQVSWEQLSELSSRLQEYAFSVDLLSVNASVEATRAGEAGAGFTAVAVETKETSMVAAELAECAGQIVQSVSGAMQEGWGAGRRMATNVARVRESIKGVQGLLREVVEDGSELEVGCKDSRAALMDLREAAVASVDHMQTLLELVGDVDQELDGLTVSLSPNKAKIVVDPQETIDSEPVPIPAVPPVKDLNLVLDPSFSHFEAIR